jgi:DNA-directed RNA polymerase sigma subunit (sigma70/sigma32)
MLGENHVFAKLTDAQVIEIRRLRTEGMTQRAIADIFEVSREHVRDITNGKYRKPKRQEI